jgi:hypothetical protein
LDPEGERAGVALAEEALIAYFKPEYNEKLAEWSGTSVAAQDMRRTGLRVLTVTVSAWQGLARLYSTRRPDAARAHHIRWALGMDEAAQPAYSTSRPFERILDDSVATLTKEVEASGRVFQVFGPALPRRSPWDAPIPSEDHLSADSAVTSAKGARLYAPPSTHPQVPESSIRPSPVKRVMTAIAKWRIGRN